MASKGITFKVTHRFLSGLFGEDVHAKRISSLANATLGVVSSASLAVNTIGQGLALGNAQKLGLHNLTSGRDGVVPVGMEFVALEI